MFDLSEKLLLAVLAKVRPWGWMGVRPGVGGSWDIMEEEVRGGEVGWEGEGRQGEGEEVERGRPWNSLRPQGLS